MMPADPTATPRRASPARLLFLVIFAAVLAVPLFNRLGPRLFGLPFFYWYQIACVPAASALTYLVFRAEGRGDRT